jgi:tetratricopeptide (TPR) repeat protein
MRCFVYALPPHLRAGQLNVPSTSLRAGSASRLKSPLPYRCSNPDLAPADSLHPTRHITKVTHARSTAPFLLDSCAYNRCRTRSRKIRIESLSAHAAAAAKQPVTISRPPGQLFISGEKRSTILCLLLALVTLAFYNPVVHNGFTNYDDNGYITDNAHVRAGLTWDTVTWAFTSFEDANWHPVTWLSHALDYQLFKLNPAGHHYVNVLLHAGSAILLFLLLEGATGLTWPSLMVAALFALHPVNVESVAWAAERKNVLSMFFFLLTMLAYGWYVRRESLKRYALVAALFAVGLMAKPEIITLPFVLLLWDYWPLRRMLGKASGGGRAGAAENQSLMPRSLVRRSSVPRSSGQRSSVERSSVERSFSYLVLEKLPLLLLSAGSAVVTLAAQREGQTLRDAPAWVRYGNAAVAYVRYIGKAFWPVHLAMPYPHPGRLLPVWEIVAATALLLLVTGLVLRWRDRRYLVVGWFWFLGTLVPVIGLVQVSTQAMADRYAYLPYIGLFVCVIWGVMETARERKISAVWLGVPAVVILFGLGVVTRYQIAYWYDSESLWRHTLSVTDRNYSAHDAFGHALQDQGRVEEAIVEYNAAENLGAYSAGEMIRIGLYEQAHDHVREAIEQYRRALDDSPDSGTRAVALNLLGSASALTGDTRQAKVSYAYALRENPDDSAALIGSGLLAEQEGDWTSAIAQLSHAVKVSPTDLGYLLLAQALRRAGRAAEADDAYTHAQQISRDFVQARRSAAQVLASTGIKPE